MVGIMGDYEKIIMRLEIGLSFHDPVKISDCLLVTSSVIAPYYATVGLTVWNLGKKTGTTVGIMNVQIGFLLFVSPVVTC